MPFGPFDDVIKKEGWEISGTSRESRVLAFDQEFPYAHPFSIHSKIYRGIESTPEIKYQSLKAMHDYAWPEYIPYWNFWDERRFRVFCEGWNCMSYAGGGSTGKSHCAGRLGVLDFLAAPQSRTVIVASTTLAALSVRIWGYITRFTNELKVNVPIRLYTGNSPKILYNKSDPIHGMYAVAAGKGTDEKAISNWIGRHPKEKILVILDEATDLDPIILKALPNLESGGVEFQCLVIGNSCSRFDLHGALSTPADGWDSIDPMKDVAWKTTQKNGICLFFSCYESPAIHEWQPDKKALLEKIFITQAKIDDRKKIYGENSDSFWRFVLGFWRKDSIEETVISEKFLSEFQVKEISEWSGAAPLQVVAGLDPAFSQGGDQCVLRLAVLGQDVRGQIVLDYRGDSLLFKIPILATSGKSAEIQIAEAVIAILRRFNCPLANMCVDANGAGRGIAEVIRLQAKSLEMPLKIYSTQAGGQRVKSFDVIIKSAFELWQAFRDFIQTNQIRGLDTVSVAQLTSRLVEVKAGRQILESKKDYKTRMGAIAPILAHSPDEADAAALCLQAAMLKYGFRPGQYVEAPMRSFADEKYIVHNMQMQEEQHGHGHRGIRIVGPPEANFSGEMGGVDLITALSRPLD